MPKPRYRRPALLACLLLLLVLLVLLVPVVLTWRAWRQVQLDRQLRQTRSVDILLTLLKHGANPNISRVQEPLSSWQQILTPWRFKKTNLYQPLLHFWAWDTRAIAALLDAGADINAQDFRGYTALTWALRRPDARALLLQRGADVNKADREGTTTFMYACRSCPPAVVLMLEHHADVNARDKKGATPLLHAVDFPSMVGDEPVDTYETVRLLLQHGADPNIKSVDGRTPLQSVRHQHWFKIARILVQAGATE